MRMGFREVREVKEVKSIESRMPAFMRISEEEKKRINRKMEAANRWFMENRPGYAGDPLSVPITAWKDIPESVFENI